MAGDPNRNASVALRRERRGRGRWAVRADPGGRAALASACVSLLVVVVAGCTGGSAETLQPGGFKVTPSTTPGMTERRDAETGTLERRGMLLEEHIAAAWGADPRDLEFRSAMPAGRYDVSARSTDGTLETAEALLRGGLVEQFGLRVQRDVRDTDLVALQLVRRGLRPQAVEPDAEYAAGVVGQGSYRLRGGRISEFLTWLRSHARRPIVDQTRLDGRYDITLEWDPTAGPRAFQAALGDAGFLLIHKRMRYAFLVVDTDSP